MTPRIKICGLTREQEAYMLNETAVDYAGFVLFYEKSKRNNSLQQAHRILPLLDKNIKKVAVTVSPTVEQMHLIEESGFDILQVHGTLRKEVLEQSRLPIFLAFNGLERSLTEEEKDEKIIGYVLDSSVAGSGKTFDWSKLQHFDRGNKLLILAGGLTAENVQEGILILSPDIVDVSSGVEGAQGKDFEKIKTFAGKVRNYE